MEERYHYFNGSIASCDRPNCRIGEHYSLDEALECLRNDPDQAFYRPRHAQGVKR